MGHLLGHETARPLSIVPLIWMMEHAERYGLRLPWASMSKPQALAYHVGCDGSFGCGPNGR
ncbi:MAG: hypothetical protein EBW32_12235 [Rhodobacteraceae bacterium]|nr:hypothetical protein [Paracoccaceae bacterium]NCW04964.1 hypothetical protein [Paracoccaceae bacterium]